MRTTILSLLLAFVMSQNGGNYRIAENHKVISERYNYSLNRREVVNFLGDWSSLFFQLSPGYFNSPESVLVFPKAELKLEL